MKARSKTEVVDATRWFADVEIEGVELMPVTAHFSADGCNYYVTGYGVTPDRWLPVDGNGLQLSFSFWDVQRGESKPITTEDRLYVQYAKAMGWRGTATVSARLVRPYGDGIVREGDWVVRSPLGALHVYSDDDFKKTFSVIGKDEPDAETY